jgi:hypothetical protein
VIWFESSSLYLSGLHIFSTSRRTKQPLQGTKSEYCTAFLGPTKRALATVNSVQRWWKKGPGQFEAMKTKKSTWQDLSLSFRGEHKPLGVLYVPRGEPQVRTLRPRQPEQAAHQACSDISSFLLRGSLVFVFL